VNLRFQSCARNRRMGKWRGMGCGAVVAVSVGCGSKNQPAVETAEYPVGHGAFVTDGGVVVEAWYPADGNEPENPVEDAFLADPSERAAYAALLATAPEGCATRSDGGGWDAVPAANGTFPVIVFSHCHGCTRFSSFSLARALAGRGYVVLAPDHVGDTLFDDLAGELAPLSATTLNLRISQLRSVVDLTDAERSGLPDELEAIVGEGPVGLLGHSFGAVTVGHLGELDTRVGGVLAMGAPVESPLFPGVSIADWDVPLGLVLLGEDHSIGEAGNTLIQNNFAISPVGTQMLEYPDGGHWTVSDLCGLTPGFMPGCGEDTRQSGEREPFVYLGPADALPSLSRFAVGFFEDALKGAAQPFSAGADSAILVHSVRSDDSSP
jgi:dienelactone hydrolase